MKHLRRVAFRSLAGLMALLVAGLIVSLDAVDSSPYFREPYYQKTLARLQAHLATNTVARGDLAAGFGRARLTPTVNTPQDDPAQGRFRTMPLAGYGDRLGVMVGADALIIPAEVADDAGQQLGRELRLSREQLYFGATHTHSGLGAWGEGWVAEAFAGQFQPGARVWFADRIVAAVREALADLKPASFGHGRFAAPDFVRNRLVGQLGKVDPEFSFALLKQQDGKLGVLGSYAAHATVLSGNVMEFSADYPGAWQRALEQATGCTAVFLGGGMGSHSPVPGEKGFAGVDRMGQALARVTLEQLPTIALTNSVAFGTLGVELSLPPIHLRITDGVRLRPWLARRLLRARAHTFLQVFRLNDTVWASTPCDFSGELALDIKDALRAHGSDAVITSFNGDYVGYVIPPRYYHLSGYEPRLMSFFGPNVPDYFEEMIRTMALGLARQ